MKRLSFIIALVCCFAAHGAFAADKANHVDAEQAAKLVEQGKVTVLDVRTPDEFKEGHIKGATNLDFNAEDFAAKVGKLDKSKPVLVHCQAGGRSTKSLPTLEKAGLEVYHLDGGFNAWTDADKPVQK